MVKPGILGRWLLRWRVLLIALGMLATGVAPGAWAAKDYLGAVHKTQKTAPAIVKTTCASCHGLHGQSISPTFPNLAGQHYGYLIKEIQDFQDGKRNNSSVMTAMAKTIPTSSDQKVLKAIAAYYAGQKPVHGKPGTTVPLDKKNAELGYQLYAFGEPKQGIPACASCHTANGSGDGPMAIPALAGQHAGYIEAQLKDFASGKRDNSPHHIMHIIGARLTQPQIKALAGYVHAMNPDLMIGSGPKTFKAYQQALENEVVPGVLKSAVVEPKPAASAASAAN